MIIFDTDLENLETTVDPASYVESYDNMKRYQIFDKAFSQLSDIHKDVIKSRYTTSKETLVNLSKKHKTSIEKIRQIEAESISIMKHWITFNFNTDFQYT